jgi:hypothetical protein
MDKVGNPTGTDSREPLTGADSRRALDIFIDYNLRMMVLCGALVAACQAENGWWCVQYAGGDPQLVPHEYATALADGFHLGVKHYHEYRQQQRELAVCLTEVDAEMEAE